jgi:hypothetical protein
MEKEIKQQTALDYYSKQIGKLTSDLVTGKITGKQFVMLEIKLLIQSKEMEKEQKIKNITDYNIKVTEFLLNQLFNLEHSKHRIACEKLSDIRNQFIYDNIVNYNETYGGHK